MRLIMNLGRTFTLIAVLGLSLSAVGCGESQTEETDAASDTTPTTELGEEAGSNTGGGAETPETE